MIFWTIVLYKDSQNVKERFYSFYLNKKLCLNGHKKKLTVPERDVDCGISDYDKYLQAYLNYIQVLISIHQTPPHRI